LLNALPIGAITDARGQRLTVDAKALHDYLHLDVKTEFDAWMIEIRKSFKEDEDFHLGIPLTEEMTFGDLATAKFDCNFFIPAAIRICMAYGGDYSGTYDAVAYLADCQSHFLQLQYDLRMSDKSYDKVLKTAQKHRRRVC
jgi:phage anti-repressor protein